MARRDPIAELGKVLDRAGSRLAGVRAGDVVAACDLLPPGRAGAFAALRRGCAAVPAETGVAVTAGEIRALLEALRAGGAP